MLHLIPTEASLHGISESADCQADHGVVDPHFDEVDVDSDDSLRTMRGVFTGLLLGAAMWVLIGLIIFAVFY